MMKTYIWWITIYHRTVAKASKLGPFVELCRVKACPNLCPEGHRVDEETEFGGDDDVIHLTVSDEHVSFHIKSLIRFPLGISQT